MPSLPPAICSTTRMDESLPVAICVAESAACAWSAEKVSARNAGTVQVSALPRTVRRKNSRRVWRVISFFMVNLSHLVIRGGHHQTNCGEDVRVGHFGFGIQKLLQSVLLVFSEGGLEQAVLERGDNGVVVVAFFRCE